MKNITGRCLCEGVVYNLPDDFKYAGYCHCSECRRFSGSVFSAFGGIDEQKVKIEKGDELISFFKKNVNTTLAFCQVCGSSLFGKKSSTSMLHIRLGTLDEMPTIKPQAHVYVGSKADWFTICDNLPKFDTTP